ncbi:hypothetical protein [Vibrio harveyi]|uniref:hypothetical protein n=1 Tax=Vibrio harveyi TaxID=669 RepID=UPI0025B0587F|nr:hypothetical protein [Vibrio harveyi]WJT11032.1 hypothetical protein PH545_28965 [Vibrio harveyi]
MIVSGYTMELICDCAKCISAENHHLIERAEYVGETYSDCAKQAREDGWMLSRDKTHCSAPNHGKVVRNDS